MNADQRGRDVRGEHGVGRVDVAVATVIARIVEEDLALIERLLHLSCRQIILG